MFKIESSKTDIITIYNEFNKLLLVVFTFISFNKHNKANSKIQSNT